MYRLYIYNIVNKIKSTDNLISYKLHKYIYNTIHIFKYYFTLSLYIYKYTPYLSLFKGILLVLVDIFVFTTTGAIDSSSA